MGMYDEMVCRFPLSAHTPDDVHVTLDYLAGGPAWSDLGDAWPGPDDTHSLFAAPHWRYVLRGVVAAYMLDLTPRVDRHSVRASTSLKFGIDTFISFLHWIEPWAAWEEVYDPEVASPEVRSFVGYLLSEYDMPGHSGADPRGEVPTLIYLTPSGFDLAAPLRTVPIDAWERLTTAG